MWTKIPKPLINKRSQKHIFKNSIAIREEKLNIMDKQKIHEPLVSYFLHVVQIVNLKDATQPLPKLQWGSSFGQHYWGHQCPRVSNGTQVHICKMGKGRNWNKYSWASSLVTWLLQIVKNARTLLLIQSGCLFQGGNCHVGNHLSFIFVASWLCFVVDVMEG